MEALSDRQSAATPRPWFHAAAVLLMLSAVAAAFVQKGRESRVVLAGVKRAAAGAPFNDEYHSEVKQLIQDAGRWSKLGHTAVVLALTAWGIGAWRREKQRRSWVVIVLLLAIFFVSQIIMV